MELDLLSNGRNLPLHAAARGQPTAKRLAESELDLVHVLIKCRPIEAQSMATASPDFYNGPCCPRPLTRTENDLEKDDEVSRRKLHL